MKSHEEWYLHPWAIRHEKGPGTLLTSLQCFLEPRESERWFDLSCGHSRVLRLIYTSWKSVYVLSLLFL
jgi:hypothetical protein